jgi:hypothetical protein
LADLVRRDGLSRFTWSEDGSGIVLTPRVDIVVFENVGTLDDYIATSKRVAQQEIDASRIGWRSYNATPAHEAHELPETVVAQPGMSLETNPAEDAQQSLDVASAEEPSPTTNRPEPPTI